MANQLDFVPDSARGRSSFFPAQAGIQWLLMVKLGHFWAPAETGTTECTSLAYCSLIARLLMVGSKGINYNSNGSQASLILVGKAGEFARISQQSGRWERSRNRPVASGGQGAGRIRRQSRRGTAWRRKSRLAQTAASFFNSRAGRNCRSSFDAGGV